MDPDIDRPASEDPEFARALRRARAARRAVSDDADLLFWLLMGGTYFMGGFTGFLVALWVLV